MEDKASNDFEKAIGGGGANHVVGDFWHLLRKTKKWWLLPILTVMLVLGALMVLGGTAAAPFIYTLF
jgi:hypothetical protein